MAYQFAVAAVESLLAGNTNKIMTYKNGKMSIEDIEIVNSTKVQLNPQVLQLCEDLSK